MKCYWGKVISESSNQCKSCSNKNRLYTQATKDKISKSKIGPKNPLWKGNKAGYQAIRIWVRSWKIKPWFCQQCRKRPAYDLANINGKYKRDINDYLYLCRSCHMKNDGRIKNLRQFREPYE